MYVLTLYNTALLITSVTTATVVKIATVITTMTATTTMTTTTMTMMTTTMTITTTTTTQKTKISIEKQTNTTNKTKIKKASKFRKQQNLLDSQGVISDKHREKFLPMTTTPQIPKEKLVFLNKYGDAFTSSASSQAFKNHFSKIIAEITDEKLKSTCTFLRKSITTMILNETDGNEENMANIASQMTHGRQIQSKHYCRSKKLAQSRKRAIKINDTIRSYKYPTSDVTRGHVHSPSKNAIKSPKGKVYKKKSIKS